jgi:ArsR family transcriptional regulator
MKFTAHIFKALAEPIRLRILALLLDGERCVCDLMAVLDMPQSTVSRHLAYLKNAGWVEGERRGVWMYYRLSEKSDSFHERLRQGLAEHLPETKEGRADAIRLQTFLRQKGNNACQ